MADLSDGVTRDTAELHGGIDRAWELDLHLWFRRAPFNRGVLSETIYERAGAADLAR